MKNIYKGILFTTCILFVFVLFSCDPNRVFDKNVKIDNGIWNKNNKLFFSVKIDDTVSLYNFYINIRNDGTYPNSNIFIFVKIIFPNGKFLRDTVECFLSDPSGKWLGHGFGDIWDNQILYKKGVMFPVKGEYYFEFEQGMRAKDGKLQGVRDIGLRIEKVVKTRK